jgi:formylglycine-generating enzyme required for sulfatase activity
MFNKQKYIVVFGFLAFCSLIGNFLSNVASTHIPPSIDPYLWLAWPLFLVFGGITIVLTILSNLPRTDSSASPKPSFFDQAIPLERLPEKNEPQSGMNRSTVLPETKPKTGTEPEGVAIVIVLVVLAIIFLLIQKSGIRPGQATPTIGAVQVGPFNGETPTPLPIVSISRSTSTPIPVPTRDLHGIPMVLIPAGLYEIGSYHNTDELPVHTVSLSSYLIDKFEVTNRLYDLCVKGGACNAPTSIGSSTHIQYFGNPRYDEYPVIFVTWDMTQTYCAWRGGRLPTEAEWEAAALGGKGAAYPWGEGIDCSMANYTNMGTPCMNDTSPVGSYKTGQSPFGVYDMAGNVQEWVADWYGSDYYSTLGVNAQDPLGPASGKYRVIRGGSWEYDGYAQRSANRNWGNSTDSNADTGFRCVLSP